jgi:agmatinase
MKFIFMSKEEKIAEFNPSNVGVHNGNLFGLPFDEDESKIIILPVPWDVTVSYGAGTSLGPQAILDASPQLDFYDTDLPDAWKIGFHMPNVSESIERKSAQMRLISAAYISFLEMGGDISESEEDATILKKVNIASEELNKLVEEKITEILKSNKVPALVGGDHSTPLGFYRALANKHPEFGILQIDAHADLRKAYEGFTYSHASVFYNALQIEQVKKLVQVGIRDICQEEVDFAHSQGERVKIFYDAQLKEENYSGKTWNQQCDEIIAALPQKVHISFDIDGLDPKLCPNTGTPVPGGFELNQVIYLFRKLAESGKEIISFDLCEVGTSEGDWDANVGARLLWKLCVFTAKSQGLKP